MVDSITPACTAATTSSPGWRSASARTASAARATKPVQLSPPGAIGQCRGRCPTRARRTFDHLLPGQAVGLARMQLAQVAVLGDRQRAVAQDRSQEFGRLDGPGQRRRVEGLGASQLPGDGRAGPPRPRPARGPVRSGRYSPALPPTTPLTLQTASPWRTSTIRVASGRRGEDAAHPVGHAEDRASRRASRPPPSSARLCSRQVADEMLQLAQRPALDHLVAVGGVLADDGVARAPVVTRLGVEPVHVAGPALQVLDHPRLPRRGSCCGRRPAAARSSGR